MTWTPASDNTGVTGYKVVLNGIRVSTTANTHYTLNTGGGRYKCVYIRAEDKDGNLSIPSERTVFRNLGQEDEPLSSPVANITALTLTTARLEWSLAEGGSLPLIGVLIMLDGRHYETTMISNSAVLRNLIPGTEYVIEIFAFDPVGKMSEPTCIYYEQSDVTPPGSPGNLRCIDSSSDSVTLGWDFAENEIDVVQYVVYNNHEYFDSTTLNTYTAVNLLPGMYTFEVCAMNPLARVSEPAAVNVLVEGELSSLPTNLGFTPVTGLPSSK